jgi:transposase-like protein
MSETSPEPQDPAGWRRVVEQQRQSGESVAVFARRTGIRPSALAYWRRRLADAPELGRVTRPTLVPVAVGPAPVARAAAPFEIVVRTGHVVRVPADYDREALVRLLTLLGDVAC